MTNPRLQFVFNREVPDLEKSFLDLKKKENKKTLRCDVMIAFWLAIEMQFLEEAREILKIDEDLLSAVLVNLRKNGEKLQKRQEAREKQKKQDFLKSLA